jgi:hypothetical protein
MCQTDAEDTEIKREMPTLNGEKRTDKLQEHRSLEYSSM